jgi:hypothetical protein
MVRRVTSSISFSLRISAHANPAQASVEKSEVLYWVCQREYDILFNWSQKPVMEIISGCHGAAMVGSIEMSPYFSSQSGRLNPL